MSLLSKTCVYGLRAALYVAGRPKGKEYVSIREIADELGLSFHFLTKILQQLTESGVMTSYRGPRGGVALARPAQKITVMNVVESIDGPDVFRACLLGLARCDDRKPCPLHKRWAQERVRLKRLFESATLAALAGQSADTGNRLAD